MRVFVVASVITALSVFIVSAPADAGRRNGAYQDQGGAHPTSRHYRGAARVKGYRRRARGGYSYQWQDSINTYGDSRSNFGGASSYRHEAYDRQTPAGPFDHGFFFDGGMAPNGGDSPYMN